MIVLTTAIAGLASGSVYALVGLSTLVTYRFVSVVNFSQTAVGALGAFLMVDLIGADVPWPVAVLAGIVLSALVNALIGIGLTTWFANGSTAVKTAVTIVVFAGVLALGARLFNSNKARQFPSPFSAPAFEVAGLTVTWLVVVCLALAVAMTVVAHFVVYRSPVGIKLRAIASRPRTASLIGIPVTAVSISIWTITGGLMAAVLMLVAPQVTSDFTTFALLITPAFAAALIGRFRSFWWTLAGGLALGAVQGALSSVGALAQFRGAIPFLVIIVVLIWSQRRQRYEEAF